MGYIHIRRRVYNKEHGEIMYAAKGGMTLLPFADKGVVHVSLCSTKDHFCKETGRKLVVGIFILSFEYDPYDCSRHAEGTVGGILDTIRKLPTHNKIRRHLNEIDRSNLIAIHDKVFNECCVLEGVF